MMNWHGIIDDPWVIMPADDVWGWFTTYVGSQSRHPWEVSMELRLAILSLMSPIF